jgi:hypothetical protein
MLIGEQHSARAPSKRENANKQVASADPRHETTSHNLFPLHLCTMAGSPYAVAAAAVESQLAADYTASLPPMRGIASAAIAVASQRDSALCASLSSSAV